MIRALIMAWMIRTAYPPLDPYQRALRLSLQPTINVNLSLLCGPFSAPALHGSSVVLEFLRGGALTCRAVSCG